MDFNSVNAGRIRREIEEAGDLEDQEARIREILPKLRELLTKLTSSQKTVRLQFEMEYERRNSRQISSDPFVIKSESYWANVFSVGAGVVLLADIIVSSALSRNWLDLPPQFTIGIGGLCAVILSFACKPGVGLLCGAYNTRAPLPARRKMGGASGMGFIVNILLVVVILSSRNPSENMIETLKTATSFSLGSLGITLPIFSGALMALAHELDWSSNYTTEFEKAAEKIAEVQGLIEWCVKGFAATATHNESIGD